MTRTDVHRFAAVDCEASSLSPNSWPIEVGISWVNDGTVETWSSLIRPAYNWDLVDWSVQSAAVHKISLAEIETAPEASVVARQFLSVLAGRMPVSDAPEFDGHWIARLLETLQDQPALTIEDYDAVSFMLFADLALDMLYEKLERLPVPHRAGPDSARLATAWIKALQYQKDVRV